MKGNSSVNHQLMDEESIGERLIRRESTFYGQRRNSFPPEITRLLTRIQTGNSKCTKNLLNSTNFRIGNCFQN
jgi:uncharacterized protein YheU (UPF0270 family)